MATLSLFVHVLSAVTLSWTVAAGPLVFSDNKENPNAVQEVGADAIEGIWHLATVEAGGKALEDPRYKDATMAFTKGKALSTDKKESVESDYKLDETRNPKTIDLIQKKPSGELHVMQGIYKIKQDTLTLCLTGPDEDRPTEFSTKSGQKRVLFTFKRKPVENK